MISQRALFNVAPATFHMPEAMLGPMNEIMNQWARIENHHYQTNFQAVTDSTQVELHAHAVVKAFRTTHRIPSFGYCLMNRKTKLKKEFENLSKGELDRIRHSGQSLSEQQLEPLMAFTGDTQIEVFANNPWLLKVPVLIVECTYLDNARDVKHARKWGHTHLDEILEILPQSHNQKILLTHLSPRYPLEFAKKIFAQRIPKQFQDLVEIFPF